MDSIMNISGVRRSEVENFASCPFLIPELIQQVAMTVVLRNTALSGEELTATFLPDRGMNLISYRKGDCEVIEQSTRSLFEDRFAGLGALIGPHFYRQSEPLIPKIPDENLFPHIARVKAKGVKDPFSHGIARYVPWNYLSTPASISAHISGKDKWKGTALSMLEGIDFKMAFDAVLTPHGLEIGMHVECERPSVVGLHYYYALPGGKGIVKSQVEEQYNDKGVWKPIPKTWMEERPNHLNFDLAQEVDFGFRPFSKDFSSQVFLQTEEYSLIVSYQGTNAENSWQLYHPKDSSFVCIEPLSAKNPRGLVLPTSCIRIKIEISR